MEYSSRFSQEVKQKLESLRATIDRDLGTLDTYVGNLTFSQADEILVDANSVLDSYRTFMGHLYRGSGKPSYAARRSSGTKASPQGKMESAALETIQSQGYLVDKEFTSRYGFNQNAVSRKLQELAATYNWQRERTEAGWRYAPIVPTETRETAPATETPPAESVGPSKEEPSTKTRRRRHQPGDSAKGSGDAGSQQEAEPQ